MEKEFAQDHRASFWKAGFDFDYICESNFPELTEEGGYPPKVGEMEYKTVIVPDCLSLRSTTIERLSAFRKCGRQGDICRTHDPNIQTAKNRTLRLNFR